MNTDKDRVWVISESSVVGINKKVESFVKLGYKLVGDVKPYMRDGCTSFLATLVLDRGYENVTEVADAPEARANELLALNEGWKIVSTSVSAKFYRMVKR